jgi:hypothetical protein
MKNSGSGVVIYIDIIGSRKIKSKTDMELHVNNMRDFMSKNAEYGIFDVWKGLDEYMIISPDWAFATNAVLKVQEILHPYGQRFILTTFENVDFSKPIHEMDNKAFVLLSDGMIKLKKTGLYVDIITNGSDSLLDSLNVSLNALLMIKNSFTANQMEIYSLYKTGVSQKEIAGQLKKSQQYVSDTLNRIKFENLNTLEDKLNQIIIHGINE